MISQDGRLDEEIREKAADAGKLVNSVKKENFKTKLILKDGAKTWTTAKKQRSKINSTEIRYLRKVDAKTITDKVRDHLQPIENVMEESHLGWFGHVEIMGKKQHE